jgi:hypothetical protein
MVVCEFARTPSYFPGTGAFRLFESQRRLRRSPDLPPGSPSEAAALTGRIVRRSRMESVSHDRRGNVYLHI